MAVDLQLIDDLELVEADDAPQSTQTLQREAPVDVVIARVNVTRLMKLDRRGVGGETRPYKLRS